jgi:hypothetical protein
LLHAEAVQRRTVSIRIIVSGGLAGQGWWHLLTALFEAALPQVVGLERKMFHY